jgi:hypothetical protein
LNTWIGIFNSQNHRIGRIGTEYLIVGMIGLGGSEYSVFGMIGLGVLGGSELNIQ